METGAGNNETRYRLQRLDEGDECLTCRARARSVVTIEIDRARHGQLVEESGPTGRGRGGIPNTNREAGYHGPRGR